MDALLYAAGCAILFVALDVALLLAFKHAVCSYVDKQSGAGKPAVLSPLGLEQR